MKNIVYINRHSAADAAKVLAEDILNRDSETFVHQEKRNRLGWEATLPEGAAYSSIMLKGDTRELLRKAYRHASNMLAAMNIPQKVRIEVSSTEDSGWTDEKTVCASTKHFDLKTLTPGQKMDIFTGTVIHEGSHLLYTDFSSLKSFNNPFDLSVFNVIEDERIEHLTGSERPGLANFLKCSKWFYYSTFCQKMRDKLYSPDGSPSGETLSRSTRLFNAFLKLVRFRSALTDSETEEFADALIELHDALTPYPMRPAETVCKALEVAAILRKHIAGEDETEQEKGQGGANRKKAPATQRGGLTPDELKKVTDEIVETFGKFIRLPDQGLDEDEDESKEIVNDPDLNKILSGKMESTGREAEGVLKVETTPEGAAVYDATLSSIRPYIAALRNAFKAYTFNEKRPLYGLPNGCLDTRKLVEAYQGERNIYSGFEFIRRKNSRTAVCLLIDESGSMCCSDENAPSRTEHARQAAVLLEQAVSLNPDIPLYVYGYTDDSNHDLLLKAYRENRSFDRKSLGELDGTGCTPTGAAVRAVTERIRRERKDRCLLVVVTDGGAQDPELLKESVTDAERNGFHTIAVGVQTEEKYLDAFPRKVMFDDLHDFANRLGRTIREAVRMLSR